MVASVYVHRFEIAFAVTMDKTFLHNPHSANYEKRRTNEWTGQGDLQKKKKNPNTVRLRNQWIPFSLKSILFKLYLT